MEVTYAATAAAVLTALLAFLVTGMRQKLDLVALLLWAAVVGLGTVMTTVALRQLVGLYGFGAINVQYRQLVIGLPLAAVLIGVRSRRRGWRESTGLLGRVTLVGALLLAPLGVWMSVVEPNRLVVHQATLALPQVPAGEQLRIGIISDVQLGGTGPGPHEQRAVEALMAQRPDIILFAGDVVQSSRADFDAHLPELRALLAQLQAPGGVYIVEGDVDERHELDELTEGTDLLWLSDTIIATTVRGVRVVVAGVDLEPDAPGARRIADALEARPDPDEVRILLAHRPDVVDLLPATGTRTDLVVAGHTHGGQIVLPVIGPLMTLSEVPREVAAGGLHAMGDRRIFVTTGVGVERNQAPKLRLLDPPSVGIVTLTGA